MRRIWQSDVAMAMAISSNQKCEYIWNPNDVTQIISSIWQHSDVRSMSTPFAMWQCVRVSSIRRCTCRFWGVLPVLLIIDEHIDWWLQKFDTLSLLSQPTIRRNARRRHTRIVRTTYVHLNRNRSMVNGDHLHPFRICSLKSFQRRNWVN